MSQPEAPAANSVNAAQGGETRELRLAVVLYGGASLAIYMHGTTKELQRLVKASALAERGGAGTTASERVYGELLAEAARRDRNGVRTRVVVDVIAGTSAGGINGVYLAKALAHNRSQDSLRDLWLERGDIKVLLRGPAWLPALLKVPLLLAGAVRKPVLKGDAIAQWMYAALRDMDRSGSEPAELETLLPPSHPLELFVTVTDFYGYRRDIAIADPNLIGERAHRHVLAFRHGDGDDDFDEAHNGALAFSARTTMSFPGAFPPISLASFQAAVGKEAGDVSQVLPELFRIYELSHADPGATFFIDGGVLDNKPFGYAIAAIKRRAAESEVRRRLLYLEPDPGGGGAAAPGGGAPSPIATVLASISGLPREEPVLDDILDVNRQNERVLRIQEIVETSFEPIRRRIEEIVGTELERLSHDQSPADVVQLRNRINEDAKAAAGFAFPTYLRSKVSGVVDSFARTVCRLSDFPDDSNQAGFVRGVVRSWADTHLRHDALGREAPADDLVAFLRTFDLAYRARRLRFATDGLSAWYAHAGEPGYPARAELDEGKRMLWDARELLVAVMDGRQLLTNMTAEVLGIFAQAPIDASIEKGRGPADYAAARADEIAGLKEGFGKALDARLAGTAEALYGRLFELSGGWAPERRADLLVRYLGFPYWDVLLYPLQVVADAGERDAVEVVRMSPRDAKLLPPLEPGKPKQLAGFGKMHFGAFFDRSGREGDYLWGRLDGAERLIGLVLGEGFSDDERADWSRKAFAAIVEEEEAALANARPLLDHVRNFTRTESPPLESDKRLPARIDERSDESMSVEARAYAVSDFADDLLGSEPGVDLSSAGSVASEVAAATQSEAHASPLIATFLWRAYLEGGGLKALQQRDRALLPEEAKVEATYVIRHPLRGGEPRHDLLVLISDPIEPRGIRVDLPPELLEFGWRQMGQQIKYPAASGPAVALLAESPNAIMEAAKVQQFGVIVATAPEMMGVAVPSPSLMVKTSEDERSFSTVGVLVEHEDGSVGVTVALHAIKDGARDIVGRDVLIGRARGVVRSADPITDSCFVALDDVNSIQSAQKASVLRGMTPRNWADAFFEGSGSGRTQTFVTGWSPELPVVSPLMQLRVLTEPDTVPGDSGAALISDDGDVLGFAFQRTGYNERPSFSSWIWADSVLSAHDVRIYGSGQ